MSTKTIRVSEEVYDRLKARKNEDESFTELLERLIEEERDIYAGFGEGAAKEMEKLHEEMNEEMEDNVSGFTGGR